MPRDDKVYKVTAAEGSTMLIRAKTRQGAISLAASSLFKAELATQDDLIELIGRGAKVIEAQDEIEA